MAKHSHAAPVLDCCFGPGLTSVSGGLDKEVKLYDFAANDNGRVLGQHDEAVRCVEFSASLGLVVSGGWDSTIRSFDPRAANAAGRAAVSGKVQAMALGGDWRLIAAAGGAGAKIHHFDLRKFPNAVEVTDCPLKHQVRSLAVSSDNKAWAVGTVEGRCAFEIFADAHGAYKSFTFKCHRIKDKDGATDIVYPVNALAFQKNSANFVTGGCDGFVCVWDPVARKRVTQYHRYPTSISSLDFADDGSLLAAAVSYTYEEGEKEHPADAIMIRKL